MLFSSFLVAVGIGLLYLGGEVLVDNSIRLARSFGVSRLVIGLTVVAFATSSPELAATLTAAFAGSPEIAVGNAFGSNVANLGLILGLSALVFPLTTTARFLRREMVFMVLVTIVVYPLMKSGLYLGRLEGLLLVGLLGGFLYVLLRDPESREVAEEIEDDATQRSVWLSSLGVGLGVILLVAGARALVVGASDIALDLGVSKRVIGLTLVALGTSLPELAASVAAARKQAGDLVLGNIIGSNIFNLLCILGVTSLVHPIAVTPQAMGLDFQVMLGISVLTLVMLASQKRLVRAEGALLLAIYLGYMLYLYWS